MIVYNNFEWDVREASACRVRHGVSFKEATTVLDGENVTISEDPVSGACRAVGPTSRGQMLVVLYKRGLRIRILDAAPTKPAKSASPAETVVTEPETAGKPASESSAPAERAPAESAGAAPATVSAGPERTSAAEAERPEEAPISAPPASEPAPSSKPERAARASTRPVEKAAASDSPPPTSGWDAATYEIYWNAYSAARNAAREQGKNTREAQRLGREAGERAVHGEPAPVAPPSSPAPKSSGSSSTWRAAARAAKPAR